MKVGQNTNVEMLAAKLQQQATQQTQQTQQSKSGTASEVVHQARSNAAGVPVIIGEKSKDNIADSG